MELASSRLECWTTGGLKPAEARSEAGGNRWGKEARRLLAQGWPPTHTQGREEKGVGTAGSMFFFFMPSAAIQDCGSQRRRRVSPGPWDQPCAALYSPLGRSFDNSTGCSYCHPVHLAILKAVRPYPCSCPCPPPPRALSP